MSESILLLSLGKKIKTVRISRNITQSSLASECNFEKASMSRIESGKSNITVLTLQKISTALNVPISEFFKD
jgi:transcriptional regulator with XRE-family HTH domain